MKDLVQEAYLRALRFYGGFPGGDARAWLRDILPVCSREVRPGPGLADGEKRHWQTLTGLRVGELLALRWRAVYLGFGRIHVSESVFQGQFQKPKSEKGMRTIRIGPHARRMLENHRQQWVCPKPEALIFPNRQGGPYRESNLLERVLRPAAKAAGIGRVTWHQFRHVHSLLLHDLGVPAKVAQQQLGHATVETTLYIYKHAPKDNRGPESCHERGAGS